MILAVNGTSGHNLQDCTGVAQGVVLCSCEWALLEHGLQWRVGKELQTKRRPPFEEVSLHFDTNPCRVAQF